ncbi:hypothetical protein [Paenibacillus sp. MBLB4367]|uniref:hypothetical protein n=1 Tax=Paenibacillus sp. MBLB4367 TaxID=3384767 RepID=UPI003907F178
MNDTVDARIVELLQTIRPWFSQEDALLIDLAKHQPDARLAVAAALLESGQDKEGELLLGSIVRMGDSAQPGQAQSVFRAMIELAYRKMEQLNYDEAEDLLWRARHHEGADGQSDFSKADVSLLIAECRFGQGFIQDAIDRAEEILRKQQSDRAKPEALSRTYQQLGWFTLHKADVPASLAHMKQAMKLAPALDRELVEAGLEAEQGRDFAKAIEHYFDSIRFEI